MIVDYNYKYLIETPGTTGSYTITHKNNKGLIYYPGLDDAGNIWPVANFYTPEGGIIGITLGVPSGSFGDLYVSQFKPDDVGGARLSDINFPLSAPPGSGNPIFLPIQYQSLIFTTDTSSTGVITNNPTIITLY